MIVLVLTLLGGWLRFRALGRDSFWLDEAFSALVAGLPPWELLQRAARDGNPPLYYLLLHSLLIFGDSEAVLRVPSALFGTLSIPLLYLLGRVWFSASVGMVAALLLAISPIHLWHSQDARTYSLLMFEGIMCWYLFGKLVEAPRRMVWAAYGVVSCAVLYTHYFGALLLLPQTGVVFLLRRRGEIQASFWPRWLVLQGGLALSFVPWGLYATTSIDAAQFDWIAGAVGRPHPLWAVRELADFAVGKASHPWLRRAPFLALAVLGLVRGNDGRWRTPGSALHEREVLLCLTYLVVPIAIMLAISQVRPLLVSRHLLMVAPPFFLLTAVGLFRLRPNLMALAGTTFLVLLILPGLRRHLSTPRTADYRGATALIAAQARKGDLVLFTHHLHRFILEYYVRGREVPFRWCPQLTRHPSLKEIQECVGEARRIWLVSGLHTSRAPQQTSMVVLGQKFASVRAEQFYLARVVLFERTS